MQSALMVGSPGLQFTGTLAVSTEREHPFRIRTSNPTELRVAGMREENPSDSVEVIDISMLPRLECSGMIIAYFSLNLMDLRNPPNSASRVAGITGCYHSQGQLQASSQFNAATSMPRTTLGAGWNSEAKRSADVASILLASFCKSDNVLWLGHSWTTEMESLTLLPRLVLNSWPQAILLPWPPKAPELQVGATAQPSNLHFHQFPR
uniref:uncharacterized protein LOC128929813 n=1 Tax=Callithrix jacchus TaxID=9483 RepID=UPI0023DD2C4C|nr:uncharacterized protein LOC128929813 [Callithrix jacchus]